ncbi:hypothetical protein EJ08DRAFT_669108 [Tothia fuscella]|uniref:Condensation domain-containing protein n=1 Tax=Tothia fuscella TaxID=1048955 RepID=A0A9P4NWF1_9PEZI|nr:hypothetical protein EJ08DRAFT_669108 [Tothia fuscella]
MGAKNQPDWLRQYANNYHAWRQEEEHGRVVFKRPVGLVEGAFDIDGVYYGGRADMHATLTLEMKTTLTTEQVHQRIIKAWSILRLHHPLISARVEGNTLLGEKRAFVVRVPADVEEVLSEGRTTSVLLQGHQGFNIEDFLKHAINTGRAMDPAKSLAKLFIFPFEPCPIGNYIVRFMQISAHMISDGLTMYNWISHFIELLNSNVDELERKLRTIVSNSMVDRLPPAQEDLYPPIGGNLARRRWYWAIQRVLRHIRKPKSHGFAIPLRRKHPVSVVLDEKYPEALDYNPEHAPHLRSGHCTPSLSSTASKRLVRICREEAKVSVGAGLFALVGLAMMELEEELHPATPLSQRAPFLGSFPLNPRPFFNYTGPYDSCMLAFSDGLVLPFLPSETDLAGRLRLLARSAHRQLKSYQKKAREPVEKGWDPHNPLRTLADGYLSAVERADSKLPEQYRRGINPQGALPANVLFSQATCGVSSVGPIKSWVAPGKYPLDDETKDLIFDYRLVKMGVRARDNEFLVGSSSDSEGNFHFNISYDASALDEELVERWKAKIESILEEEAASTRTKKLESL